MLYFDKIWCKVNKHMIGQRLCIVVLLRKPLSFLSSVLPSKEVAALDHHDLAHAVVLIKVMEVLDGVVLDALTEGPLAHLSTWVEVPGIDPLVMEPTVVGDALWWVVRIKAHLCVASLPAVTRLIEGAVREVVHGRISVSPAIVVNLLEVAHLCLYISLLVGLAKGKLKSRNVS